MKCAHCSAPVPDTAKFCHSCGSQVSDAEGQARVSAEMDRASFLHLEALLREDTKGEFEIRELLGRGGMAVVFLATEIHLARKVAIKVLPPELTFGHGVERFKREAKTAAALDHPHIIPIYRVASGGKLFWYAMKFLEGRALDELLKEVQHLSLEQTIDILEQAADALDYAHEHQVIHRDMKPANVMLDRRNRVVVTDFGIAKALTEGTLTASGSVVGTPYYMSPEQGMGKLVTGAADQYSMGVMAYRMLSGQVPFEGDSAIDILHKHCMVAPPPLAGVRAGLPAHVYWAVHKALDKKPEHRFSSVTDFVEALKRPTPEAETSEAATVAMPVGLSAPGVAEEAATIMTGAAAGTGAGAESAVTPLTPVPAPSPPRKRRRALVGASLGIIAVASGAAIAWWVTQERGTLLPTGPRVEDTLRTAAAAAPVTSVPSRSDTATGETPTPGGAGVIETPTDSPSARQTPPAAQRTTRATERAAPLGQQATPPAPPTAPPPQRATPPKPTTRATTATTGRITIANLPSRGRVFVDGRRRSGTTFELRPGQYVIRLTARGFEPVVDTVKLAAGQRMQVPFVRRPLSAQPGRATTPQIGVLDIRVRPWANLSIGGVDRGRTTQLVDTLQAGRHTIRFVRAGYATKDTTITLTAGDTTRLRIKLEKSP